MVFNEAHKKLKRKAEEITDDISETTSRIKQKTSETTKKLAKKTDELARDMKKKLIALFFIALAGFFFWVLMNLLYFFYGFNLVTWIKDLPYVYPMFLNVCDRISSQSQQGIYYLFSFSSLFFLPFPLEFVYFGFLKKGFTFPIIYFITLLGVFTGQCINFMLGRFLGFLIRPLIKRKTRKALQQRLHKYGAYAIFIMHLLPLPYPLFNFVVGLTKYNFFKWVLIMLPSLMLNYLIVYLIYLKFF